MERSTLRDSSVVCAHHSLFSVLCMLRDEHSIDAVYYPSVCSAAEHKAGIGVQLNPLTKILKPSSVPLILRHTPRQDLQTNKDTTLPRTKNTYTKEHEHSTGST